MIHNELVVVTVTYEPVSALFSLITPKNSEFFAFWDPQPDFLREITEPIQGFSSEFPSVVNSEFFAHEQRIQSKEQEATGVTELGLLCRALPSFA
ncbi:hypothetical protein NKJ88_27220 [Mesorhizobium sp. M0016]|uniref:hypothetical protein n=1 Tax=Mesorhizobium sp. M0016 TaxID=2956843 RepID=UPI00333BB930